MDTSEIKPELLQKILRKQWQYFLVTITYVDSPSHGTTVSSSALQSVILQDSQLHHMTECCTTGQKITQHDSHSHHRTLGQTVRYTIGDSVTLYESGCPPQDS